MLPSPEDLADPVVQAVGAREDAGVEVDEVEREEGEEVTVMAVLLVVDLDVDEVATGDSEGEDVEEVEREELPGEFLEECVEVVVEVVEEGRVRPLHSNNSQQPLTSRGGGYLRFST